MVRHSRLVIFYFKEKFCVSHALASRLRDVYFLSVPKTLSQKLYLQLNLTQIVHSNSKMLFLKQLIVFQSFYGALLVFSHFLLQGNVLCFALVGMSLSRCLLLKRSKDLVDKIIKLYLRFYLTQIVHSNGKIL